MGKILDTLKKAVTTVGDAISNAFSGNSTDTSGGSSTANQNVSPKTAAVQTKNAVQNNPAFEAPQTTAPKTSAVTTKSNSASYNPLANAKQGTLADVQQAEAETAARLASAGITPTYSSSVSTTSKQNAVTTKSNSVSGASNTSDSSWTASNGKTLAEQTKIYEDAKSQFDAASSEDGFKGFGKTKRLADLQKQVEEAKAELDKMTKEKSIYDKALSFKDATDSELAETWDDIQKRMKAENADIKTYDDLISELTGRRDLINLGYATTPEQAAEMTADIAKLQQEIDEYSTKKNEAQKALDDLRGQAADDFTAIQAYLSGTNYLQNKYGTGDRSKTYQELEQRLADSSDSVEQSVLRMDMALMKNGAEYDRYLGYDVKEAENLIKDIKTQQDTLDEEYVALADELAYAQAGDKTVRSEAQIQLRMNQIKSEQASLQEKTDGLREEIVGAKSVQKLDPYYHLPEAKDFEEYSKKGAAVQNQEYDATWDSMSGANTWYVQMDNPAKAAREAVKDIYAIDSSYRYMTDEEYSIYNYLLAKEGKTEAEKFHTDILDLLNSREGGKIAENIENADWTIPLLNGYYLEADEAKRAAGTFALAAASGLNQFGHGVSNTVNALTGNDPNPTSSISYAAAQVREGLKDIGPEIIEGGPSLAQAAFDAVSTTANMAPMMALGLAGGAMAAGLPTWAGAALSKLGNVAMAVSAGGNYYEEALQKGYNKKEAGVYATFAGASEAVLQDVLGGIATLGGAVPNYITGTMLNNIDDAWLKLGAEILVRDVGEGIEEYAQDVLTPAFFNLAAGDRNTVQIFNNKDATYSFLLACATTTLLEAGDVYTDTVAMDKLGKPYHAFFDSQSDLIKNAAQWDNDVGELAQKIQRGDVRLNDTNLGKIVAEYARRGEGDYVNAGVLMSIASDTTAAEDFAAIYAALENPDSVVMDEEAQYIVQSTPGADADWGMQQQALLTALMNGSQLSDAGWRLLDVTNPAVQEVFSRKTGARFGKDLTKEEAKAIFEQTAQTITNWKESMTAAMENTKKAAAETTERIKQAWVENTGASLDESTATQNETAARIASLNDGVRNDSSIGPKERTQLSQQLHGIEERLADPNASPREKAAALAELAQLEQRVQVSPVSPRENAAGDDELRELMEQKADPNLSPREIAQIDARIRELGEQRTGAEKSTADKKRKAVKPNKEVTDSGTGTPVGDQAKTPVVKEQKPAKPNKEVTDSGTGTSVAVQAAAAQKKVAQDLSSEQAKEETKDIQKAAKRAEAMSKAEAERRVATFREGLRKMTDADLDNAEAGMAKLLGAAKKGTAERAFLEQAALEILSEHARRLTEQNNRAKVQAVEDLQNRGAKAQPVAQTEKTPTETKQKAAAKPKAKEVTDSGTGTPATVQSTAETKQAAAAQKKATPEEKAKAKEERLKRWYKDELDKTKAESAERQQYLKAEYEKNKDFYESLDVGDTIYADTEDGVIPVGKVTEKTEDGVGITFYDNKGAFSGRSRILTKEGTLSYHEGEIPTLLAAGVDLEKSDGTRTHYGPEFVTEAPTTADVSGGATPAVEVSELETAVAEAETGEAQPAANNSVPDWYDESMGNLDDKVTYANGSSYTRRQWIERGMERFGKTAAEANEGFNRKVALQRADQSAAELVSQPAPARAEPTAESAPAQAESSDTAGAGLTGEPNPVKLSKKQQALVDAFNANAQSISDSDLNDLINQLTDENGVAPQNGTPQRELLEQLVEEMALREQEAAEANVAADLIRDGQINRIKTSDLVAVYDYMVKHEGFNDIKEQVADDLINRGYERYVERINREANELSAAGRAEPVRSGNSGRAGVGTAGDVGSSTGGPAGNGRVQGADKNVGDTGGTGSVPPDTGAGSKQPVRLEAGERIGKGLHVPKGMQYADSGTTRASVGERLYDTLEKTGLKIVGIDVLCDENGKPVPGGTIIGSKNANPTIYVSLKHGDYTSSTPYTARGIAVHEAVHQWLSRAFGVEHAAKAAEFVKGIIEKAGLSAKESADLFEGYSKQIAKSYPELAAQAATDQTAAKRFRNQVWEEILGDMVGGEPFSFVQKLGLFHRGLGYFARQVIEDAKLIEQSMQTTGTLPTNVARSWRNGGGIDTLTAEPLARDDIYGWTDDMLDTAYKVEDDTAGRDISSEKIQFALGETARKIGDLVGNKNTVIRAVLELNRDFWTDGHRTGLPENVAAVQEALLANNDETLTKAWLDEVDKIRSMYATAIAASESSSSEPASDVRSTVIAPEAEQAIMEQYSLFEPEPVVQEIPRFSSSRRAEGTSRSRRNRGRVLEGQLSVFEPIPAIHPSIQRKLDAGAALEKRVADYFENVPKDSQYYLAPEEISAMMEVDPFGNDYHGYMNDVEQVVMNLSDLSKEQTGEALAQTYELMDALIPQMSTSQASNWKEEQLTSDSDFTEWYNRKHPSLYYPGYVPGQMNTLREMAYLEDYIKRGDVTDEDRVAAQEMLERMNDEASGIFYKAEDEYVEDDMGELLGRFTTATEKALNDPRSKVQNAFNKEGVAKADNLKSMLQKLVKPQEMQWTGLNYFFDQHKGQTVTKQDVLDYIAENNIQISTTMYGDAIGATGEYTFDESARDYPTAKDAIRAAERYIDAYRAEYGIEGDSDYSVEPILNDDGDLIIRVTTDDGKEIDAITIRNVAAVQGTARWGGIDPKGRMGNYALGGGKNYREQTYKLANRNARPYKNAAMSLHFNDSDLLGHSRVQDFTTPDGKKVLFIEEIQSDWASRIRKEGLIENDPEYAALVDRQAQLEDTLADLRTKAFGYGVDAGSPDIRALRDAYFEAQKEYLQTVIASRDLVLSRKGVRVVPVNTDGDVYYEAQDENGNPVNEKLQDRFGIHEKAIQGTNPGAVAERALRALDLEGPAPDMPFGSDYYKYILKNLLFQAALGDYDYIAWATPEMQSWRYYNNGDKTNTYKEYQFDFRTPQELAAAGVKKQQVGPIQSFLQAYANSNHWSGDMRTIELDGATPDPGQEITSTGKPMPAHRMEITEVPAMALDPQMRQSLLEMEQPLFKAEDEQAAADAGVNLDEAFPEGSLERTLLEMMRTGRTSLAQAYIQGIVDRAKNPTYTEEPSPTFTPVTDEEIGSIRNRQSALIDRYGRLEPGEEPARDINVAQQQNDATRTRRHAPHVAESKNVPEHTAQALERFVATDEAASYVRIPDKEATNYADALIKRKGIERCMKEWDGIASAGHNPTKYDIALGETLALWAAHNGRDDLACKIWADLNVMGTQAGQVVQAMSLIKKMSPEYQAYYVRKVVDELNDQYKKKIMNGWKGMTEITIDQDLEDAVVNASTQQELEEAMDALLSDIAKQVPASFKEKWDSWRYFAMLGNPRTHVRNILGNTVFAPLVFGKNLLATGLEKLFVPEDQRTKAIFGKGKYMDFAKGDFEEMKDIITGEGNKYTGPRDAIMKKRQIWKTGIMNRATKVVGDALNTEDTWFLKPYYANALAGFLAARNADISTLQSTPEGRTLLNEARQYAMLEAQKATYRDASVVAQALNKIKKVPGIGWLLDGILPFTGTPINVLKRGIEYSPVGLLKTLTYNAGQLANGSISASKFIDNLSSGMTGTMVAALGFWLAQAGILRGGDDDDDKRNDFLKNMGFQNFSINLDINGTPMSYTIDWAAPSALPLFTGAAAYKLFSKDHELSATDIGDALLLLADPMMQLSMLDGLNRTLSSLSYASTSEMASTLVTEMATSYLGQAVPTFLGQIARTIDDTRRSSYTDKNSDVPKWLQYFIQSSVQNKIPVWEKDKMAYVDSWGRREVNSNIVLRALENFLSPGYINEITITPVDEELDNLSRRTGNSDILPRKGGKYFSVEGERKDMTAEEFQHFCEESGQVKYALLNSLFSDKRYTDAPDSVKAALVEDMYKYANASTKYHIDNGYDIRGQGKWIQEAEASGNVYESIMNSLYAKRMEDIGGIELPNSMKPQGGLTDSQYKQWQEYGEDAGLEAYEFADALQAANADENSSVSQDEMGSYLSEMIRAGGIDEQQAEAIWNSNGWKTSYGEWAGKHPNATVAGTQEIKEGAKEYGMSTTAYQRFKERAEPYGVSIESYVTAITASDTDGNGSLKQEELGTYLNQQVRSGQMSKQQAEAVWNATGKWKTSYDTWYNKGNNAYRNEGEDTPTWEQLMELNETRGNNYVTEGAPVTQEEYDQDYLDRGYSPMRTGDVRSLVSLDDGTADRAHEIIENLVQMYQGNEGGYGDGYASDMLYDYLVLGPDYEGQSFEDYMQTYAFGKTPHYSRTYQPGTGTKAAIRGEGLSTTGAQGAAGGATQAAAVAKRARAAVAKRKR